MNETQIKEAARIIEARDNGEKIQGRYANMVSDWIDLTPDHKFNFKTFEYRVATKRGLLDLPVDTLVELRSNINDHTSLRYINGEGSVFVNGSTSHTDSMSALNPQDITDFKVVGGLITEWHGGECPVPDWVRIKGWLNNGLHEIGTAKDFCWDKNGNGTEIMMYKIIGEVEQ